MIASGATSGEDLTRASYSCIVPTAGPAIVTETGDLCVTVLAPGLAVIRATLAPCQAHQRAH